MIAPEQKMNPPPSQEALSSKWKAASPYEVVRNFRQYRITATKHFISFLEFGGIIKALRCGVKRKIHKIVK